MKSKLQRIDSTADNNSIIYELTISSDKEEETEIIRAYNRKKEITYLVEGHADKIKLEIMERDSLVGYTSRVEPADPQILEEARFHLIFTRIQE